MGFMRGQGAVRRVPGYLQKGKIVFRSDVRAVAIQWNPDDNGPANHGIGYVPSKFVSNPQKVLVAQIFKTNQL